MPRDSNGNYSLPSGNPVVTGTTISSSWANTTLSDLASEMTDSLDRSGKGGMLAAFKLIDGSVSAPAFAFQNEPTSGIWRESGGTVGIAILAANAVTITANGISTGSYAVTGSVAPANGIYLPAVNQLGFITNSILAGYFDASQNLQLANPLAVANGGTGLTTLAALLTALGIPPWTPSVVANNLVQRDASGFTYVSYLNQSSANNENPPTISQVMVTNGSDNFLRKAGLQVFAYDANAASIAVAADPGSGYPTSGTPGQAWAYY